MSAEVNKISDEDFYTDGAHYWSEIPPTIDGMLGGFGFISQTDIKGSKMLLKQLFNSKNPPGRDHALDCGAGIGRITKFLLTDLFEKVDLVEQNPDFVEHAKSYLGAKRTKVENFYSVGLQHFQPEPKKYDVIWIQWVAGHLTDSDLITFLESCRNGLKRNGVIVVKENITSCEFVEMDKQDSSVTRPMWLFLRIFGKANLECYRQMKQHNFPKGLYSVYMFVLKQKLDRIFMKQINTIEEVNSDNVVVNNNVKEENVQSMIIEKSREEESNEKAGEEEDTEFKSSV